MEKKTLEEQGETDKFRAMYRKVNPSANDTAKYLTAVMYALFLGIAGVALIGFIRPDYDILVVAGFIFAFLTPILTSILGLMKSSEQSEQIFEAKEHARAAEEQSVKTDLSNNGRLEELLRVTKEAAYGEGRKAGREESDARTDKLAENKKE